MHTSEWANWEFGKAAWLTDDSDSVVRTPCTEWWVSQWGMIDTLTVEIVGDKASLAEEELHLG